MERIPGPARLVLSLAIPLGLVLMHVLSGASAQAAAKAPVGRTAAKALVRTAITSPADGSTIRGRVPFTASASADAQVARVDFRIDGVLRWTDKIAPYRFNGTGGLWKTTGVADGRHTLTVTALDRRGRIARDASVVTIDNVVAPAPDPETTPAPATPEPAPAPGPALDPNPAPAPAPPPAVTPPPTTASVFLSPSGSDANNCSAAAPCQTLDRGYHAAAPGAVVQLAGGSYPGGQITFDNSKVGAAGRVILSPATGASVSTGDLGIDAQHLELRNMAISQWQTTPQAADVMFRDVDQGLFYINSSESIALIGGSAGPFVNGHPQIQSDIATPPRNILIDGVRFHDFTRNDPNVHTECLQIGAADGLTVRNSTFRNCHATANLAITHWGPSPDPRNITVENNFFSSTVDGFYSIQANSYDNLLVRNNSALQGILIFAYGPMNNVRVVANLAPMGNWECISGIQYRSNVWFWPNAGQTAAKCNASDTSLSNTTNPGFVNPGALDLHLSASSPALGKGAAAEAAATDIDGDARGAAPDAGADER